MTLLGFDRRDAATARNFFRMFLRDRFLGSRLGAIWAVMNPLLMLAIYTFVFGFVFKARLPGADTTLSYSIWLIAGYGPWLAIAESLNSAASSVVANASIVKNMAFKTECLPIAAAMTGVVPLAVSIVFVSVLMVLDGNVPTWHVVALIPALLITFAFLAAVGLAFAALTVFVRDFAVMLPTLLTAALFASPIFYPLESVPRILQVLSTWNPLFLISELIRQPLVYHRLPPASSWLYMTVLTLVLGLLSVRVFRRVKGSFSSMI